MGTPTLSADDLLEKFSHQRILVVGDVMLDWFIWGGVSRISPEAPVPVVEVQRESRFPGGAANVARNITPFGGKVELAGLLGIDPNADLLKTTLDENGIGVDLCVESATYQTITKTRVVAQHQQVVRIDREKRRPISEEVADQIVDRISRVLPDLDGLIIEDYGKGLITPHLITGILNAAKGKNLQITVDPKPGNPIAWRGVTTVKPNRSEAFAVAGIDDIHRGEDLDPLSDDPLLETGHTLLKRWECEHVLLTLGELGMLVFSGEGDPTHIPARAREVFDVSGAGDTAIAIYTLGLCSGLKAVEAAKISNLASSIVVGKLGTTPIESDELHDAIVREFGS